MVKYDSYKNSGVEWIGDIPNHWNITKHKHHLRILSGFPFKSNLFDSEKGFPILRIRDITSGKLKTYYTGEYSEEFIVEKGDLLIGMDGDFNLRWWNNSNCLLNQRCCSIRESKKVLRRFLYYLLPNELNIINDLTYYTTVKHLSVGDIYDTKTILPPTQEQQQIVSFLDTKTSLIDSLIEKTQKKIELLKEQRISLINQVVTKGLNLDIEMKDSGVKWIGEIPIHWEMKKIGYISVLITGNPWKSDLFNHEEGIKIVRGENVSEGFLRWGSRSRYWTLSTEGFDRYYLNEGDIIIGMDGSKVGKNYVRILSDDLPLLLHQRMCRIRCNKNVSSKFVEYFIGSEMFRYYINISKTDPMIPHITQKNIFDFKISFPEFEEQQQIVDYLDDQTKLIDSTISKEKTRIELLQEYRQSLISEVVTGKIKVTNE